MSKMLFNKMEVSMDSVVTMVSRCEKCGKYGLHKFEIFTEKLGVNETLEDKIELAKTTLPSINGSLCKDGGCGGGMIIERLVET